MNSLKKVAFTVILLLGFLLVVYLIQQGTEFHLMFKIIGIILGVFVILIWQIKDNDPSYYDFLKLWVEFHIFDKHRDPKPKAFYEKMLRSHDKLYLLEKTHPRGLERKKMLWKKQLIEAILDASGLFHYKATGKQNHKMRYKFYKGGNKYKLKGG